MLTPNGTMNNTAATLSATWCAVSAVVPISPINSAALPNRPYSSENAIEIGVPIATSARISGQSTRKKCPNTRNFLNGRMSRATSIEAIHMPQLTIVVPRPAPTNSSRGKPNAP